MRRLAIPALLAAALLTMAAGSNDPSERMADPSQEARARHLFQDFRCVVCQNESIDDSDADLAHDLRMIVRQQVAAGRSDAQIRQFMVDRYGEFILLKPPFDAATATLWLTPALIVVLGGAVFALRARRKAVLEAPLTADEERRLNAVAEREGEDMVRPKIGHRAILE
jgi:cytochrome c-type biogenesis protein CcmH